ncbi:hypothetical protein [Halorubrum sp. AJ67]|nr:hypothetical protein [Halorubrum sp. AJ67]CDK38476.1 hypothetical protein BN903_151 [Halorubrum sp. AJ67]
MTRKDGQRNFALRQLPTTEVVGLDSLAPHGQRQFNYRWAKCAPDVGAG